MFVPNQPTLFHDEDRPAPELVADAFGFKLAYHDTDDGRLYSVQDWLIGVAKTNEPRGFWRKIQYRVKKTTGEELWLRCPQLPYKATNGKTYQMAHADAETLYYITQRMDAETGIRDEVLRYLAKAGVILDELRQNPDAVAEKVKRYKQRRAIAPEDSEEEIHRVLERVGGKFRRQGKTDRWIEERIQGIIVRKQFIEALKAAVLNTPDSAYGQATDRLYMGLWQRTTAQLRGELDLKPRQNVRDHFGAYALLYTRLAEMVATDKLDELEIIPLSAALEVVWAVAKAISQQAQATSLLLGLDLVTERPLLKE